MAALVIGLVALGFTFMGLQIGKRAARARLLSTSAEVVGGVVLLVIGFKILWDHGAIPY